MKTLFGLRIAYQNLIVVEYAYRVSGYIVRVQNGLDFDINVRLH